MFLGIHENYCYDVKNVVTYVFKFRSLAPIQYAPKKFQRLISTWLRVHLYFNILVFGSSHIISQYNSLPLIILLIRNRSSLNNMLFLSYHFIFSWNYMDTLTSISVSDFSSTYMLDLSRIRF